MKTHPLVKQLRFTRGEFQRALKGLTEDEAQRRFLPMNCISWNVGHLAWQEQNYFLIYGQGRTLLPDIHRLFSTGAPASTPPLAEMLEAWHAITVAADPWLDILTIQKLLSPYIKAGGTPSQRLYGNLLQRVIYHYWYHTGENMAIRQNLGHTGLPQFVGSLDARASYTPE